jgi:hypothetical protein
LGSLCFVLNKKKDGYGEVVKSKEEVKTSGEPEATGLREATKLHESEPNAQQLDTSSGHKSKSMESVRPVISEKSGIVLNFIRLNKKKVY